MSRSRLYGILGIACAAGYAWLFWSHSTSQSNNYTVNPCFFKAITGLACPSCGSTRAIGLLLEGSFVESVLMNPVGIFVAMAMVLVPLWIAYDLLSRQQTLFDFYFRLEKTLSKRWIAAMLIVLILANWAWNLNKNL